MLRVFFALNTKVNKRIYEFFKTVQNFQSVYVNKPLQLTLTSRT